MIEGQASDVERRPAVSQALSHIYEGKEATTMIREQTISRASHKLDICDDSYGAAALVQHDRVRNAVRDAARVRNIQVRFITEVAPENLAACKELAKFVELRHVSGVKGNFAVTDHECYSFSALSRSALPEQAIHSSQPALVEHEQYVFQTLWGRALPYEQKVKELEEGIIAPRIDVTRDTAEIQSYFLELVKSARSEILFLFPTIEAFEREESIGVIDALNDCAVRGVNIRIVSPVNEAISRRIKAISKGAQDRFESSSGVFPGKVQNKVIEAPVAENTVTILVVDRKVSFIIEQRDNKQKAFSKAIGLATFSTSKPSVSSNTLFFETLWQEAEYRENEALARKEESRARRQSELLQDILTHDIRNYNQVIKLSSELLEEEFREDDKVQDVIKNLLEAVNGSTQLLERAKKLGKILSENRAFLYPTRLADVIKSSLSTVRKAFPEREIDLRLESKIPRTNGSGVEVIADDLLDEVFVNAFSNSVRYTEGNRVEIEISVDFAQTDASENGQRDSRQQPLVRISIADHGRGIPDELKSNVFNRYLKSAKGTGLGMSIIHALVVERYHGSVAVADRVPNEHEKGTKLEFLLRYSPARISP